MSEAKDHIQSIVTAVENLGYTFTDEYYDFVTPPTSGNDKMYRIESRTLSVNGMSGGRVEKNREFVLWVAFKLPQAGDRKQGVLNVIDAQEAMEDAIFKTLAGKHVKITKDTLSAIKSDYILVKLMGEVVYWKEIS